MNKKKPHCNAIAMIESIYARKTFKVHEGTMTNGFLSQSRGTKDSV